jgi:hypothetical protein
MSSEGKAFPKTSFHLDNGALDLSCALTVQEVTFFDRIFRDGLLAFRFWKADFRWKLRSIALGTRPRGSTKGRE